jgi:hypothetical protein
VRVFYPIERGRLLVGIACTVMLFSCRPKRDYKNEIASLDSAVLVLKNLEATLIAFDTTALKASCHATLSTLNSISPYLPNDTLTSPNALLLSAAYAETKNAENLMDNQSFMLRALSESYHRMNDLKHDLQKNLIEEKKDIEYVTNEINASQKLEEYITTSIKKAKVASIQLDSIQPTMKQWADSILSKKISR